MIYSGAKPQDRSSKKGRAHGSGRQTFMTGKSQRLRYRTLRALGVFNYRRPGVPLRSTPGFMLPPAARVWKRSAHRLVQTFLQLLPSR